MKEKVLVVGATGYLGRFVVQELKKQGYWIRVLARSREKLGDLDKIVDDIYIGEATQPDQLGDLCRDINIVFSSLGITRQKDKLTYLAVDYQANKNILELAKAAQVSKFMYISVFNAKKLLNLKMVAAKEKFAGELISSAMNYIIVRPNGFFSDMGEFFKMASSGRVYLFGSGKYRANPIHGADLAEACVAYLERDRSEIDIGGPEILSQLQIVEILEEVLGKSIKISRIPLWVRDVLLKLVRTFSSVKVYGPIEFLMTVLAMDMVSPQYGQSTLKEYYEELNRGS